MRATDTGKLYPNHKPELGLVFVSYTVVCYEDDTGISLVIIRCLH